MAMPNRVIKVSQDGYDLIEKTAESWGVTMQDAATRLLLGVGGPDRAVREELEELKLRLVRLEETVASQAGLAPGKVQAGESRRRTASDSVSVETGLPLGTGIESPIPGLAIRPSPRPEIVSE